MLVKTTFEQIQIGEHFKFYQDGEPFFFTGDKCLYCKDSEFSAQNLEVGIGHKVYPNYEVLRSDSADHLSEVFTALFDAQEQLQLQDFDFDSPSEQLG